MDSLIISIVTWNSADSIKDCVRSVLDQSYNNFKLYVVDNASADNTWDIIQTFSDPRLTTIKFDVNKGFCGGHNHVLQNTKSEFVLLVNPDIILSPDYIEKALNTIRSNDQIGTVCGLLLQKQLNDPDCMIDSAGLTILPSRIMSLHYHGKKPSEIALTKEEVFGADGALPLYRRKMIDDISIDGQFFDERFFAHKEDWDVSWRAHIYGWKTIFDPACVAIHPRVFKPGNLKLRRNMSKQIKIDAVKNQLILLLKNESTKSFFRNFFKIVPRQIMIFFYILFAEPSSLKAYSYFIKNYSQILQSRRIIQKNRKVN